MLILHALKWICGIGSHHFKFNILDPNLKVLYTFGNFQMNFKTKTDPIHCSFPIINFNFNAHGVYWIEIFLNDHTYLSVPLPVYKL